MTTKTTYAFFAVSIFAALSLAVPMVGSAFADHTATQPNANVSYDSTTNEVQVEWDFTTGPNAPTTCLLKGDMWFFTDLDNAWDTDQTDSDTIGHPYFDHLTRITGFVPIHYSVVSATPTTIQTISEVIPCKGTTRIDIDTVMSHPSNVFQDGVTPREDLQIFLSFYSQHENKDFTFDLIDEVFVFYTPNVTWSTAAKNYACAGQAGNTIYIDQSAKGIHTNNGDNCGVYLELNSNQWIDIAVGGAQTLGTHVAGAYPLLISTSEYVGSRSGGGCSECTPPTLGLDSLGNLKVKDGITINGHSEDGGYFHTDYPMQYTTLGKTNHIILKYYENQGPQNIKLVQLGIGVKEIGTPISESQALIEVWIDDFASDIYNPLIKEIIVIDPDGIISNEFASVFLSTCSDSMGDNVKLSDSFEDKQSFYRNLVDSTCLSVSFGYSYDKVPQSWILSSNAIDYYRNTINNYFNDGLTVIDDSPTIEIIPEPYKYECKDPIQKVMTRNNCNFNDMILSEANRALAVMEMILKGA